MVSGGVLNHNYSYATSEGGGVAPLYSTWGNATTLVEKEYLFPEGELARIE